MYKKLRLNKPELIAVLMCALDAENAELVRALRFCAMTDLGIEDLVAFKRQTVKLCLANGVSASAIVERALGLSPDVRLVVAEMLREDKLAKRRRSGLFAAKQTLLSDLDAICKTLQICDYNHGRAEKIERDAMSYCLTKLYSEDNIDTRLKDVQQVSIRKKSHNGFQEFTESLGVVRYCQPLHCA